MARRGDEEMVDAAPERRIRSTVTQVRKTKGRGFNDDEPMDEADERRPQAVQTERTSKGGPIKCKLISSHLSYFQVQESKCTGETFSIPGSA